MDALKRVRLVTVNPTQAIRLTFGNDEIYLAAGVGTDSTASETVDATIDGERMEVGFNPEYLVEALGALAGETGRFRLNTPSKSVLLDSPDDESYRHVLMPVRL